MGTQIVSLEEALELSIKKWEYIVKKEDDIKHIRWDIPEIANFPSNCGLCAYHFGCSECPIYNDDPNIICCKEYDRYAKSKYLKVKMRWAKRLVKRLKNELKKERGDE